MQREAGAGREMAEGSDATTRRAALRHALANLLGSALAAGLVTGLAVVSIRAQDPALAGLGLAAVVGLVTIGAQAGAGIGAVDPAWMLALLLRRRVAVSDVLATWAAQAVGAVAFGAVGRWVVDDLRQWSVIDQPDVVPAAVVIGMVAVLGSWIAITVATGAASPMACGLPALGAAAALPPAFAAAANPAALFGLGVAGVADWSYVFFTVVAALAGAVVGSLAATAHEDAPRRP